MAANKPQRLYYGWRIALALAVTETVSWGILYYSFSVFLLPMQADLSATRAQVSGAFSIALLISGIAAIPVGRWIDRHGARALMSIGSLAAAGLVWAWSATYSLPWLYLVFGGVGLVMAALLYDTAFAVITKWFQNRRQRALTLVAGLASTIFIPVVSLLLARLGWRSALMVLALLLLAITAPLHALVLRRRPQDLGLMADGEPSSLADAPAAHTLLTGSLPGKVVRNGAFWLLTAALVFSSGVSAGVGVHFISYLVEQGHASTSAAVLAGLIGLMQLPGRLVFEPLSRLVPRRWLTAAVLALEGGAVLLLIGTPSTLRLIAFVSLFGMSNGVLTLARATSVADLFGTAHYGAISGLMAFWITLGRAAGPTAVALLYTGVYRYQPALIAMAVLMVIGSFACFVAERQAARTQANAGSAEAAPA